MDDFQDLYESQPVQTVVEKLQFTEGPVWTQDNKLVFSDIPANRLYVWDGKENKVYREPSENINGNTIDAKGNLWSCHHGSRRVSQTLADGSVKTIADQFEGKKLNSPNDLVLHSKGVLYFTDPPYGIRPAQQEQAKNNVFRFHDGKLTSIAEGNRPNGVVLSPDEKTLYWCDTAAGALYKMSLNDQGVPTSESVKIASIQNPDGLRVDVKGNVWSACGNGVVVNDPSGKELGVIPFPQAPANLCFGEDGMSLFVTARTAVYKVRTKVKGLMPGFK